MAVASTNCYQLYSLNLNQFTASISGTLFDEIFSLNNTSLSTAGVMVVIKRGMWHLPLLKDYGDTIRSSVGAERRMMKGQPVKVSLRVSGPHYHHPTHHPDA